mmetsp:Transcript_29578/g.47719  ORF Transcript_29578/g.47719 Transcript_29578/m.47719 type:complete len:352 (+) Transcript_29578:57-1112(+)|eukprot:CAMPEP_0184644638 /NCGR_PEP_ID=MMETSP0308-20130426/1333_1 /TAXON_ID=38269 /ORGANISM="Gloeochaete witrockiana, Strain SAG 46.84" /LENGTH=351 /DNA_ID=CAMNT_0027073293 /DNA_START=48 /DNA_END=1103 /DNA_ORIENTATION=+
MASKSAFAVSVVPCRAPFEVTARTKAICSGSTASTSIAKAFVTGQVATKFFGPSSSRIFVSSVGFSSSKPQPRVVIVSNSATATKPDYAAVKAAIISRFADPAWDDGSWAPVVIRLAWHAAGTFSKFTRDGGSNGATMRYHPESADGANAGLDLAREHLEEIKKQFPWISYADLWSLAGVVAVEAMGGPKVQWRAGRLDALSGAECPPTGRLPDASKQSDHLRDVFGRMGFGDRDIVALSGAHTTGRCHRDRSGWEGPWTFTPIKFTNAYFKLLIDTPWTLKKWDGPEQYEDPTGNLMMLPSDMALTRDPIMKKYVEEYANDQAAFFRDFAIAFQKLLELGVQFPPDSSYI